MKKNIFSDDVASFFPSPAREIFQKVDLTKIYSFSGGYPAPESFPVEQINDAVDRVLKTHGPEALQYGGTWGIMPLRQQISKRFGVAVENIQITTSSQQGIDVCSRIMLNPGDGVLTTSPTYLGAIQSFRSYRAEVVGVEYTDDASAFYEAFSLAAKANPIKFVYIIPDFQNPTGVCLSLEHRKAIVRVAEEEDLIIVEDAPYRELRFEGEEIATIYSMAPDRTLHLGSFSKICAPGMRLGWIFGPVEILRQINICKQSLDLCPPMLDQYVVTGLMERGVIDWNVQRNKPLYKAKRDEMLRLLEKYMPEGCTWTHPSGGLFVFVNLPQKIDVIKMLPKALDAGVAYVIGAHFFPHHETAPRNLMRLNFSYMSVEKMEPGMKILSDIIKNELK